LAFAAIRERNAKAHLAMIIATRIFYRVWLMNIQTHLGSSAPPLTDAVALFHRVLPVASMAQTDSHHELDRPSWVRSFMGALTF
jgi:hypothetical protein